MSGKKRNAVPERADEATDIQNVNVNHGGIAILRNTASVGASNSRVSDAFASSVLGVSATAAIADGANAASANGPVETEDAVPVKKRRTKNFKWREDMAKKSRLGGILTRVPALEPATFLNWDEFIRAWTEYMVQTKTLYRRRSSCSTVSWNSKNRFKHLPVPDTFQYATMAYWCTHGCIQPSRGTGVRAHLHNRFTGCTARITADAVYEKGENNEVRWFIRVRNQISQHNHRISDEIFTCYTNNSSVPDELLLGPSDEAQEEQQRPDFSAGPAPDGGDFEIATPSHVEDQAAVPQNIAFNTNSVLAKEVLADEQKFNMARSELQPLLEELRRTPSRVIHKRLQDVSEFVMHLLSKWEQDRVNEDRHLHFIAQSAANVATADQQQRLAASRSLPAAEATSAAIATAPSGEMVQVDAAEDDGSPPAATQPHVQTEVI